VPGGAGIASALEAAAGRRVARPRAAVSIAAIAAAQTGEPVPANDL